MDTGKGKPTGRMWLRSGVAGMASYLDAAAIVSTGAALVLYKDPLGLSAAAIGALSAALTLAIAVGSLLGGRLGDRFGRRRVFVATVSMLATGAAVLAAAPSRGWLLPGVLLLGFAAGADLPVSISLIGEEAPAGARGKLIALSQLLWYLGMCATQLTGLLVGGLGATGARLLYLHVLLVALLVLALRLRMPESRQWASQRRLARELDAGAAARVTAGRQLLRAPHRRAVASLACFYVLTLVAANTMGQFTTYLYVEVAGTTVQVASGINLAILFFSLAMAALFMRVVDGRHRMRWYTLGAVGFVLYFALPAVLGVHVWSLALAKVIGTFGTALAFEAIFKVWSQEAFPTLLRSTAQGAVMAVARGAAAAAALWTPTLLDTTPRTLFVVLAAVVAVAMLLGPFIERLPKRTLSLGTPGGPAADGGLPAEPRPG
ncbi:MFS transporter [Streptomyces lonarensis]|uniref:MFS transporter n=1 Tax=Streptomyces lonarensis TaxID=700599 RepID=A0A7X6CXL9_9ACTN|nr:MFS transporter [Streptomyces lonarensis]NJQ04315.1 MFS transporter [Streptomyces lonarensis]